MHLAELVDALNALNSRYGIGDIVRISFDDVRTTRFNAGNARGQVVRHHGGGMADTLADFTVKAGRLRYLGHTKKLWQSSEDVINAAIDDD